MGERNCIGPDRGLILQRPAVVKGLAIFLCLWLASDAVANSAVEPVARKGRSYQRYELLNDRVQEFPGARLLFVGDSITHFWEMNGKEIFAREFSQYDPINIGISGDRTEHLLWRLRNGNVDGIDPEAAVLMIGTNNVRRNTAEETAAGIVAVVEEMTARFPEMQLLLYGIFPRADVEPHVIRRVAETNAILAATDWPEQVRYKDIRDAFLDDNRMIQRSVMFDYLHLTRKGFEIWAEDLAVELPKMLQPSNNGTSAD